MKTMLLQDGDLIPGDEGFQAVSGEKKLRQDLGVALREPIGVDRFHPGWGSYLPGFIGQAITERLRQQVQAEGFRVVSAYSMVQLDTIRSDQAAGSRQRVNDGEVIRSVDDVRAAPQYDSIHLRVSVSTMAGRVFDLVQTVRP